MFVLKRVMKLKMRVRAKGVSGSNTYKGGVIPSYGEENEMGVEQTRQPPLSSSSSMVVGGR